MEAALGHEVCPQEGVNPLDRTLERAKTGNTEAFRELVEAISPGFVGLLTPRLCADEDTASAVLQDAWTLSWPRISSFTNTDHLKRWVYRVSANTAVSILRRATRERRTFEKVAAGVPCSAFRRQAVEDSHPVMGADAAVRDAIESLPDACRPTAVLAFLHGCTPAEVGRLLRISMPAVKMRLHRIRELLRPVLRTLTTLKT